MVLIVVFKVWQPLFEWKSMFSAFFLTSYFVFQGKKKVTQVLNAIRVNTFIFVFEWASFNLLTVTGPPVGPFAIACLKQLYPILKLI